MAEDERATLVDPQAAARAAGLRYVEADEPAILRRRRGRGFSYAWPSGASVKDEATLARIRSLAVPPAWEDVRICRDARGHVQATGRDARGRKQYRYHARWREVRDEAKFEQLAEFAEALPRIRRRVATDLRRPGLDQRKVTAAVVRLLDLAGVRLGNDEYARQNRSYGLTTLRDRHVTIVGATIEIDFPGKGGRRRHVELDDRRLARIVKRCQELPGQRLFRYRGEDGELHVLGSADVNDYLHEVSGRDLTSKHFRTWSATVAVACALQEEEQAGGRSLSERKRCVTRAVEGAAELIGNTPTVCRSSYVHPLVVDGYLDGGLCDRLAPCSARRRRNRRGLDAAERAVLELLRDERARGAA